MGQDSIWTRFSCKLTSIPNKTTCGVTVRPERDASTSGVAIEKSVLW